MKNRVISKNVMAWIVALALLLGAGIMLLFSSVNNSNVNERVYAGGGDNRANGSTFTSNNMPGVMQNGIAYVKVDSATAKVNGYSTVSDSRPAGGNYVIEDTINIQGSLYSVTSIESGAFYNCSYMTSIDIGMVTSVVSGSSFYGCYDLESITVDSNNTVYNDGNDANCIIESATNKLIVGCKSTIIPESVESLDYRSFSSVARDGGEEDGDSGVYYLSNGTICYACDDSFSASSYSVKAGTKYVWDEAFAGRGCLESVDFSACSSTLIYIGKAFTETGLTTVTIPENVEYIGSMAFNSCGYLTEVVILGDDVDLVVNGEEWGWFFQWDDAEWVFDDWEETCVIKVPYGKGNVYKAKAGWSDYANIIVESEPTDSGGGPGGPENTGVVVDVLIPSLSAVCLVVAIVFVSKKSKKETY